MSTALKPASSESSVLYPTILPSTSNEEAGTHCEGGAMHKLQPKDEQDCYLASIKFVRALKSVLDRISTI
jgi:hypothetical protein